MYFEDANGFKDTLVFGYDATATDSIDLTFQEENIISDPWSNQFEVRITVLDPPMAFGFEEYASVPEIGHLKKQIKLEDCIDQNIYVSMLQIKNAVYPISVTWNNSLFSDPCRSNSLITDWHPSGWFDAFVGSTAPQLPFELYPGDSASFTQTSIHNVNSSQDTLDVLYVALGNENQVFIGLDEFQEIETNIYPNPANDFIIIDNKENYNVSVDLYDENGKHFELPMTLNNIDIRSLASGVYFLEVEFDNGKKKTVKFIKK